MSIHQSYAALSPAPTPVPVSTAGNTSTTNNTSGIPQLHSRAVGTHARSFGFDWDKRTEQHRYRRELGLPDIHAAIINDDWDTALELVCPEDLGLLWIPPTSHHSSPTWANTLFSKDETKQQFAIIDMATEKVGTTTVGADVVAYGANLLTIERNGHKIAGIADDGAIPGGSNAHLRFVYLNPTYGFVYGGAL